MPRSEDLLAGVRVLVVEDNFLAAEVLCELLRSRGCTIVGPAPRLENGLKLAETSEFDAAVLDINLHGEPCFPITERLQERGIPFMFVTGYDDSSMIPPHLRSAVRLCKPVADDVLVLAVEQLVIRGRPATG